MLHEILLSLSGHPSPLLRADTAGSNAGSLLSPAERELLATVVHLSDLHAKLLAFTAQISSSHPSTICRAVATAIDSVHLAAFRRKVLEVEESVLRKDAGLVGAYNIVPLTAVVGEFSEWTRRMEWLWHIVRFMLKPDQPKDGAGVSCSSAQIIDKLRSELQTGYLDVEAVASNLVNVAETSWLKQVSAWMVYGRLPSFGVDDFFVQRSDGSEYVLHPKLLPSFVTTSTASSILFVGKSLNHIRTMSLGDSSLDSTRHLSSQLREFSLLTHPLTSNALSRTITNVRLVLSRTTLQKLLPAARVLEMLQLLREFFLLGRGEFAVALTQQADEKIRSRWRRADNLAYENSGGLGTVVVKEGEVAAILARTWAAMGSMQGQHADEDEGLELARDLLRLNLVKPVSIRPTSTGGPDSANQESPPMTATPFLNLLFSVPVVLTLNIPSPLDLFLSPSDLNTYTSINSFLLSIRRAHIRLTDLWKITSLRRHHPPPPAPPYGSSRAGKERVRLLRERFTARSNAMRSAWATSSAAIFLLAETESYLQTEVVAGLWEGFQRWLQTGNNETRPSERSPAVAKSAAARDADGVVGHGDMWLATTEPETTSDDPRPTGHSALPASQTHHPHDPQTLATAHRVYLRALIRRLLLTQQGFTDALYELLVQIDRLVSLVHRLHGIWTSADLEVDVGVVDAFVDLEREERDVSAEIRAVEARVRGGVQSVVDVLRALEANWASFVGDDDGAGGETVDVEGRDGVDLADEGQYTPRRVGGIDRLLMKLDFGSWVESGRRDDEDAGDDV